MTFQEQPDLCTKYIYKIDWYSKTPLKIANDDYNIDKLYRKSQQLFSFTANILYKKLTHTIQIPINTDNGLPETNMRFVKYHKK